MVDDRQTISRFVFAAPRNVAVRAHQNQRPLIESGDRRVGNANVVQWHAALSSSLLDAGSLRRLGAQPQQREADAE